MVIKMLTFFIDYKERLTEYLRLRRKIGKLFERMEEDNHIPRKVKLTKVHFVDFVSFEVVSHDEDLYGNIENEDCPIDEFNIWFLVRKEGAVKPLFQEYLAHPIKRYVVEFLRPQPEIWPESVSRRLDLSPISASPYPSPRG